MRGAYAAWWFLSSAKRILALLVAVVIFLAVVQGWFEPYEPPMCEDNPQYQGCR